MDKEIENSIVVFVEELKKRLEILDNTIPTVNVNDDNYRTLIKVLENHAYTSIDDINTEFLAKIGISDIQIVLASMGLKKTDIITYIYSYSFFAQIVNVKTDDARYNNAIKYFVSLESLIKDFIKEYETKKTSQNSFRDANTELYTKYIDLFENKDATTIFEDEEELVKLMTMINLDKKDQWHIELWLANNNLKQVKNQVAAVNMAYKITKKISQYLCDEYIDIISIIHKNIKAIEIDINDLPLIANKIAADNSLDRALTQNILCSMISSTLYRLYEQSNVEEKEELMQMLNNVFQSFVSEEYHILETAWEIIHNAKDFYENSLMFKDKDIMKYLDMSIQDIEQDGHDYEEAVDLKTLPIIKTIIETVDKIANLEESDQDYALCCGILSELIIAYNKYIDRKKVQIKE